MDILTPVHPTDKLHPAFQKLITARTFRSARQQLIECAQRYDDQDGNFVEQFQSTGFDARTFELFTNELLFSEGFKHAGKHAYPDFHVEKQGIKLAIECTTSNPTNTGKDQLKAYEPVNSKDKDIDSLVERLMGDAPIRLAGPLFSKLNKRFSETPYWELPSVKGHPFILAIETFHENGSLAFSASIIASYLFGIQQTPEWDNDGKLIIKTHDIEEHKRDKKVIPSGFFDLPGAENISAVLWTNAGTIPKFARMGLAGKYPDKGISALRFGNKYDPDPNAHAPKPFIHFVGGKKAPKETWGLESVLFHNPSAKIPVPQGLFESVTESIVKDGQHVDLIKTEFTPIFSMTMFTDGEKHRAKALMAGKMIWKMLNATNEIQNLRDDNPLWDRIRQKLSGQS